MGSIEDDDNDDKTQVGDDFSDKDTQFMDTQSFLDGMFFFLVFLDEFWNVCLWVIDSEAMFFCNFYANC